MILAGDIGGTHTRLALAEIQAGKLNIIVKQDYRSQLYEHLVPVVQDFLTIHLEQGSPITAACFAVAGPVEGNSARVTNLPWQLDAEQLAKQLNLPVCKLINDFQGAGYGIEQLAASDIVTLQQGQLDEKGVRVLLGAGTGLGVAIAVYQHDHYVILPSEGGHVDFAPRTDNEQALLEYWQQREGRVSNEMLLSGQGLVRIYEFLLQNESSASQSSLVQQSDSAAAISEAALQGDVLADKALIMFIEIYAAQASNLALTCLARGGVYLAGGIAPKIISKLQAETFRQVFCDKPPMHDLLSTIPVKVIMNTQAGLLGAAAFAQRYSSNS